MSDDRWYVKFAKQPREQTINLTHDGRSELMIIPDDIGVSQNAISNTSDKFHRPHVDRKSLTEQIKKTTPVKRNQRLPFLLPKVTSTSAAVKTFTLQSFSGQTAETARANHHDQAGLHFPSMRPAIETTDIFGKDIPKEACHEMGFQPLKDMRTSTQRHIHTGAVRILPVGCMVPHCCIHSITPHRKFHRTLPVTLKRQTKLRHMHGIWNRRKRGQTGVESTSTSSSHCLSSVTESNQSLLSSQFKPNTQESSSQTQSDQTQQRAAIPHMLNNGVSMKAGGSGVVATEGLSHKGKQNGVDSPCGVQLEQQRHEAQTVSSSVVHTPTQTEIKPRYWRKYLCDRWYTQYSATSSVKVEKTLVSAVKIIQETSITDGVSQPSTSDQPRISPSQPSLSPYENAKIYRQYKCQSHENSLPFSTKVRSCQICASEYKISCGNIEKGSCDTDLDRVECPLCWNSNVCYCGQPFSDRWC